MGFENEMYSIYYKVLGVNEEAPFSEVKHAYREKVRRFHPDLCREGSSIENHLQMVRINFAYHQLQSVYGEKRFSRRKTKKAPQPKPPSRSANFLPVEYKDPAYVYYKQGFSIYKLMSDNFPKLSFLERQFEAFSIAVRQGVVRKNKALIHTIIKKMPSAYYYFTIVLSEYPESYWAEDSFAKMRLIERLTPFYRSLQSVYGEGERVGR